MPDQAAHQQVSPLKMRNLRAGRTAVASVAEAEGPPVTRGPVEDEAEFDRALAFAIAQSRRQDVSVAVFKLMVRVLSLQRGAQTATVGATCPNHDAVFAILDAQDVDLVYLQTGQDQILGFVVDASQIAAERFLGRLFSSLSGVLPDGPSSSTIAPQLGAAFIGEQIVDGDAGVSAAGLTLGQTSVSAPFLLYNDYVLQRGERELRITESLPQAVAANQIGLEFQPRAASRGNQITGIEAFARWRHDDLGSVSPIEFLQIADRLNLTSELGRRLRDRAVGSAVGWFRESWLQGANLWLNVSYTELCRSGFASSLAELREQYPDVSFGIEIIDGPLLDEPAVSGRLEPVRRLGIDIALDNVGASAISIGRLHRLPVSAVNLDGLIVHALVSDPSYQHLAATICEIAHGRGMVVTACQTETREQLATVRSLGIDNVQGQVLHGPAPASTIQDLLSSGLSASVGRRRQ